MAAQHTDLDCWVKRKKKGYLFLTGDERPYPAVSRHQIGSLVGQKLDADVPIEEVIAAAAETYHIFFLVPDLKRRRDCERRWRDLLGDHVICMEDPADACAVAASIVGLTEGVIPDLAEVPNILCANGIDARRASSIVRVIRPYANLLDPHAINYAHLAVSSAVGTAGGWMRRIFG
jgi:hypothetical protein